MGFKMPIKVLVNEIYQKAYCLQPFNQKIFFLSHYEQCQSAKNKMIFVIVFVIRDIKL